MSTNGRGGDEHRVVVTGMGVVSPVGDTVAAFWEALIEGRSGITRWRSDDPRVEMKIGGDLRDFDFDAHLARVGGDYPTELAQRARKTLRSTSLAARVVAASALQAWVASGLAEGTVEPERFAHVLGGHNLNSDYIADNTLTFEEEPEYIDPLFGVMIYETDILARVSEVLNLRGTTFTVGAACASGNMALLGALDLLRSRRADAVVVSASAFGLPSSLLQAWARTGVVATSFDDAPERASRPFDQRRAGFVPSMGAATVILETLPKARARGATIHGELLGAASASSASRLMRPQAEGQVRAMRGALRDARVDPERVTYINAHGISTPLGDTVEVAALKETFGEPIRRIPVNSTKSLVGHCLTGAGMVEFVATLLQMRHGILHPTINQDEPDPELDLDFVPNHARDHRIDVALSNSFGFGNLNACVVVGSTP